MSAINYGHGITTSFLCLGLCIIASGVYAQVSSDTTKPSISQDETKAATPSLQQTPIVLTFQPYLDSGCPVVTLTVKGKLQDGFCWIQNKILALSQKILLSEQD